MILPPATIAFQKNKKINLNTLLFNRKIFTYINRAATRSCQQRIGIIKLRGAGDKSTGIERVLKS